MAEQFYLYAGEDFERSQRLRFENVRNRDKDSVRSLLQKIADRLGREVPPIEHPRAFLKKQLTTDQKMALNSHLAFAYAQLNVAQQEQLREVAIRESREPMVRIKEIMEREEVDVAFSERRYEDSCGKFAGEKRIKCLRREVAYRLASTCRAFNAVGYQPYIEDSWRPEDVQEGLLLRRIVQIAKANTQRYWEDVKKIAMSLTASSPGLAGHQAGAAVDLRLRDRRTRNFCDLGNGYPEGSVISSLRFPYVTYEQWKTRTLFAQTMRMAGFKLLWTEDWHASFGDRGLGTSDQVTMKTAQYGPLKTFDLEKRRVQPYTAEEADRWYLKDDDVRSLVALSRSIAASERRKFLHSEADVVRYFRDSRSQKNA